MKSAAKVQNILRGLTMAPMLLKFSSLLNLSIILSSSRLCTHSFMLLIRVRSNVGTWKLQLDNADKTNCELTVDDVLSDGKFKAWKLVQPLSLHPSGKEPLSRTKTLSQQGLSHGSMIYCRVKADSADNLSRATVESQTDQEASIADAARETKAQDCQAAPNETVIHSNGSKRKREIHATKNEVIELLSSDDEEDEIQIVQKAAKTRPRSSSFQSNNAKQARIQSTASSSTSTLSSTASCIRDFRMVSYNIWFGPPDPTVNQLYPRQRMAAIAQILEESNSDSKSPLLFVGFQEVTSTLRQYLQPHLEKMGYKLATQPLDGSYGVGLAVSTKVKVLESKFVPYPSSLQARGLLFVRTATHLFATTHLESFINKANDGSQERQVQIRLAAEFCQEQLAKYPTLELAIVAGDFNWDDERKRGKGPNEELLSILDDGWKDAGKRFEYTYDGQENCMLGSKLKRRFDRCIYLTNNYKNGSSNKTRVSLQTLGKDPIVPPLKWNKRNPYNGTVRQVAVAPSDHFGIEVRFQK